MSRTDQVIPAPRLYMAPLKGVTDYIFRNAFAGHFPGIDLAVAPFIAAVNGNRLKKRYIRDLLPENNQAMPVIPQILSRTAQGFVFLANLFYDMGYETTNWNLGCPFPMSPEKNRAAFLLPHGDLIEAFLEEAVPCLKGKMSIKARLGLLDNQELLRLIPVLNRFPIEEVIIHPRTGMQRYEGKPDLSACKECIADLVHPVVYNGDIRSFKDFQLLAEKFPTIDRWMIGRWLLVDPFLPLAIKTGKDACLNGKEKRKQFHDDLFEQYRDVLNGPKHLLDRMKGLWSYTQSAFQDGSDGLERIRQAGTMDAYQQAADHFFQTHDVLTAGGNSLEDALE
ncbi:MAG: tRNA-dihydrouridine synthase family protein [Desulfobacteraceae bacterium]|nr:MAG: tRNA-dihydrouridine synthase family protein [Desulfobacteraceae bacterium]